LHQEGPSEGEILLIFNFLTSGNQTELLRPLRVHVLIRLSATDHEAIITSMPLYDEWDPIVFLAALEVAIGGADEDLTMVRSLLMCHLLVAQEAI
jgi:hypothetical protein